MVECQAAVDTLDQTKVAGLGWQTSSNGGGICVIHMMSQDACSGFQSDGWNCVCWNYPGNGLPEPSANGNPSYPCYVRSPYTWVQQGENSCKDQGGQTYNYCSKDMFSATETMVEFQAAVDTLDQTKVAGLGWQTSSNGGGICVIHMMSQDACSGFQ